MVYIYIYIHIYIYIYIVNIPTTFTIPVTSWQAHSTATWIFHGSLDPSVLPILYGPRRRAGEASWDQKGTAVGTAFRDRVSQRDIGVGYIVPIGFAIYIYIYIFIFIYTFLFIYIHIYIYMFMYIYMHTNVPVMCWRHGDHNYPPQTLWFSIVLRDAW